MHVKKKCPQMFLAVTKWHYNGHTVPGNALIWFVAASVLKKTVGSFHLFHRRNVISLLKKKIKFRLNSRKILVAKLWKLSSHRTNVISLQFTVKNHTTIKIKISRNTHEMHSLHDLP